MTPPAPSPARPWTPEPAGDPLRLTSQRLQRAITLADVRARLVTLADVTARHGGKRVAGSPGYSAAVEYVARRLRAAGYVVERHAFEFAIDGRRVASASVVGELAGADGNEVLILGAHLDSVAHKAGMNDNGSGSMVLLALAERLASFERPARTVRFAFWGAEEPGRYGSTAYVDSLSADERRRITAYLNFDMLGSPNFVRFIYADEAAADGSAAITDLFAGHFDTRGLAWDTFDLSGKSDQAPFSAAGMATGGLFSGGGELKTDAQAASMGGTAGLPADGCDAAACDTLDHLNGVVLDQMADAIAHAIAELAGG